MDKGQIDNIENMENYMLHGRGAIIQKLRQLIKSNTLVTIYFGGQSILTAIVDVLTDRDLVVLDFGPDDAINKKLINASHAVVKASYQGITAQFSIDSIQKARLKGNVAFACPLPDSMLWVQRRETYRIRIPLSESALCKVNFDQDNSVIYTVLDVSTGGLAFFDPDNDLSLEPGRILESCKLVLGEIELTTSLEIRNHIIIDPHDMDKGTRCGCAFLNSGGDFSASLQKYINTIDIQQKR